MKNFIHNGEVKNDLKKEDLNLLNVVNYQKENASRIRFVLMKKVRKK